MILLELNMYPAHTHKNMMNTNIYVDYNDMEFETTRENNHSITATSDQVLLGSQSLKFQENKTHRPDQRLPTPRKEYLCLQIDCKSACESECDKSRVLTKVIESIIEIGSFDHMCVIIKELFHSEKLKQHIVKIVLYQSLSNSAMYKHRYLEIINKLLIIPVKCDYQ